MDNIPEIHDIFIPSSVSCFPLAYGGWLILGIVLGSFFFIKIIAWGIHTSKKYYALNKLKHINSQTPIDAAIQISELLRRICNLKYKEANALYGDEWISFLNQHTSHKIKGVASDLLVYAPFMNKNNKTYKAKTAEELKLFCKHWIGANL